MQKRLFLTLTVVAFLFNAKAQAGPGKQAPPLKIGYVNMEDIFRRLPEAKKAESEYMTFQKQLQNQLEMKSKALQQKMQAFEQGYEAMTEAVRNKKQVEIQQLQTNLQQLQMGGRDKLQNKYTSLIAPLYTKIKNSIEAVAKKHGYTYVFNINVGEAPILLYATQEHDISKLVLKQLGVNSGKNKKKKK